MKKLKNFLFAATGFVILVGAFVLSSPSIGQSQPPGVPQNVLVVNPATNPVRTAAQGTTTIAGAVTVTNTPTVSLAPGASVGVHNTAPTAVFVKSVDDSVRQIYQVQLTVELPMGSFGEHTFVTVPFGKRLVIEHVSVAGIDQGEELLRYEITTEANNVQATHRLVSEQQGHPSFYYASQQMRIYGDPDSLVIFSASRPFGTATASATMTVSGYFVDVP